MASNVVRSISARLARSPLGFDGFSHIHEDAGRRCETTMLIAEAGALRHDMSDGAVRPQNSALAPIRTSRVRTCNRLGQSRSTRRRIVGMVAGNVLIEV